MAPAYNISPQETLGRYFVTDFEHAAMADFINTAREAGLVVDRSEIVTFERELDEWLSSLDAGLEDRQAVREMLEAGLETDAAGINARHRGKTLIFDQRMIYLKAVKP